MTTWHYQFVETNGLRIHLTRTDSNGRPILLLHGITDNGRCMRRVAEALAPDYHCILVDARGHGLSDKPASGYGPLHHAADLAGLTKTLGLDRPAAIGHSMGAAVAATTAYLYPNLFQTLILEDPPWDESNPDLFRAGGPQVQTAWTTGLIDQARRAAAELRQEIETASPSAHPDEIDAMLIARYQTSPHVFQWLTAPRVPWTTLVERINLPALLLTGDPDRGALVSPEHAAEAARRWPGLTIEHIPGAGHNIRRDRWDAYRAAIRRHLDVHYPA